MSGDWAKVELNTPDKPEIWLIANILGIDPDAAFGKVFRIWAWFDEHTEDGNAHSVTKQLLDRKVGVTGFCDSMLQAGWMVEKDDQITLFDFSKHNGATAKKRANTAKRVAQHRANPEPKQCNAQSVTSALAREEKRREENISNKLFDQFWNSGIRKTGKKDCEPLFKKIISKAEDKESFTQKLVSDIQKRIQLNQLGFENLHPKTYLNGERWTDDYPRPQQQTQNTASIFNLQNKTYVSGDL
jgi:hypothetical protein